jgi:hypothetical protein
LVPDVSSCIGNRRLHSAQRREILSEIEANDGKQVGGIALTALLIWDRMS